MIDLEALALARARELSQDGSIWVEPIHKQFFDVACANMSDGEIQETFRGSDSPAVLASMFEAVAQAALAGEEMPFQKFKAQIFAQGLDLANGLRLWHGAWTKEKVFSKCLSALVSDFSVGKKR